MQQSVGAATRTHMKPGPQMGDEPNLGTLTQEQSDSRHSFAPPTPQWQQESPVEMYKDLGDQAGEDDCAGQDDGGRRIG